MRNFAIASILAAAHGAIHANQAVSSYTFEMFETEFSKTYENVAEREYRRGVFNQNIARIISLNEQNEHAEFGINRFADMTAEERTSFIGRKSAPGLTASITAPKISDVSVEDLPESVDWRQKGVVSDVRSQGSCGSCWAFGAVATIESYHAIATGTLPSLSEQQIVDCVPNPEHCGGTGGCSGGVENLAYEYAMEQGLVAQEAYPYTAKDGKCQIKPSDKKAGVKVAGWMALPANDYEAVIRHIALEGPLSISVAASDFFFYRNGVFTGCAKGSANVDMNHAVQLVGYGTDEVSGLDYWLVRNSWGASWGERGYIRIWRNKPTDEGFCGVDTTPENNSWCEGTPKTPITVCGHCGVLSETSFVIPSVDEAVERV